MTSAMAIDLAERRVNEFRQRCGDYGEAALHLAYHAALPVALNAELLHLLRINFFLDPPETLPYTVEFEFLLSPLCREIDQGLYEIEPEIRDALLAGLTQTYETQRIRDLATLLWQYVEHHSPWGDRVELERAQQLTALNFLDAEKAKQWLSTVDPNASQGEVAEREWFVAMRQEIEKQTQFQQDEATIDRLLVALQASNYAVRQRAVETLGNLGSEAAISALISVLHDENNIVRLSVAETLGKIGSEEAILVLISALHDENNTVRSSAAEALGKTGSEAAIPALINALSDVNNVVRSSAAEALGKIGSELAIPALASALGDPSKNVRLSVTEALGEIGSGSAIPALLEALNDSDSEVRQHTASTLMKLGHDQENDDLFDSVLERLTEETYIASLRSLSDSKEWILRGEVMRIGRGEGNDLILQQPEVSRQHAEIVRRDFQDGVTQPTYSLRDFSRHGTWMLTPEPKGEGWRLIQQQEVELPSGTQLRFGNPRGTALEFSITPIEVLGQESNRNTTATGMVLWVDDHPNNNIHQRQSLEELGIQFVLATTPEEALEILNRQQFDVIISHIERPPDQQVGYTLLDQLRSRNNQTPFIIYAGSKDPKSVAEARRRGALGYTDDPSELSQMVLSVIGQTESSQEISQDDASLEEADRLNRLAEVCISQGHYNEAEQLYLQALQISRSQFGLDHPNTALSLNNLAGSYRSQGRYSEAEPLYLQALQISRSLGPDHPNTAGSLNNLALLYDLQGRYSEAEPLYLQALDIIRSRLGPDHPDTATSLNNLAGLYHAQERYREAKTLYDEALAIYRRVLGEEHPSVIQTLEHLETLNRQMTDRSQPEIETLSPEQQRRLQKDEARLQEREATLNRHLQNLRRDYAVEKNAAKRLKLQKQIEAIDLEIEHLQADLEKINQQLS